MINLRLITFRREIRSRHLKFSKFKYETAAHRCSSPSQNFFFSFPRRIRHQMRRGRRSSIAISLPSRSFSSPPSPSSSSSSSFSCSSSSCSDAADEAGKILAVASICKAFGRGRCTGSLNPSAISDAVVLQVLRHSSLNPRAKFDFLRWTIANAGFSPSRAIFSELLLAHCRSGLLDELRPVIRLAAASSSSLDPSAVKLVLDSLIRSGRVDSAIAVLDDLEALGDGFSINPRVYNSVVLALIQKSQIDLALSVFLKLLEASSELLEARLCNELLLALRREGMKEGFAKVFDELSSRNFKLNGHGYNICIHAFGSSNRLDLSLKLFKQMKEDGLSPDICTYNSLIRGLFLAAKGDEAIAVYEELKRSGHEPDRFTYHTLVHGCCKLHRLNDAVRIFEEFLQSGVLVETQTYNSLLDGLLKGKKLVDACQLFERMVSHGVRASPCTYNILIHGLCKNGRAAAAMALFSELKKKGQFVDGISYSTVIIQLCREGQVEGALAMAAEMEERGLAVDLVTLTALMAALRRWRRQDWALPLMKLARDSNLVPAVLRWTTSMESSMREHQSSKPDYSSLFPEPRDLRSFLSKEEEEEEEDNDDDVSNGWSPSPTMDKLVEKAHRLKFSARKGKRVEGRGGKNFDLDMVNTHLRIFLAEGKLSGACKLFEILTEGDRQPGSYTYNAMASSFFKKGYLRLAWGVLQEMEDRACNTDVATYNLILQGLGKVGKGELVCEVVEQMKKKGGFLDIVMYNTLIHVLGRAGKMDAIEQLMRKMKRDGLSPDVVTFNTLIEVHVRAGSVGEAYRYLRMMLDAGCSPNHVTDTILDSMENKMERARQEKASMNKEKDGCG
ncbi:tetratricopeptide repeat (TPR)-like superfamily protein [Wolffia australiana]